jgi:uncharacterized membrane protein YhhN
VILLNIYAEVSDLQWLRIMTIPMVGVSLLIYLLVKTRIPQKFHQLIFMGLVFSLAGDIQLLFGPDSEFYLMSALLATVISYAFYGAAFYHDYQRKPTESKRVGNLLFLVLFLADSTYLMVANRNMGTFKYAAILYFAVSAVMSAFAGYRYRRVNNLSFRLILTGCFAFVISDLSIGYYTFIESLTSMKIAYLVTYFLAQYLVVTGTIERRVLKY